MSESNAPPEEPNSINSRGEDAASSPKFKLSRPSSLIISKPSVPNDPVPEASPENYHQGGEPDSEPTREQRGAVDRINKQYLIEKRILKERRLQLLSNLAGTSSNASVAESSDLRATGSSPSSPYIYNAKLDPK